MTTAPAGNSHAPTRTDVSATDGITLAVHAYTEIDPRRPTVLAVHGYPDNHHLWDGVAEHLSDRYNLVAYDVRGAGESGRPAARSASPMHAAMACQPASTSKSWPPGTSGGSRWVHSRCPAPACAPVSVNSTARQLPVPASMARR